MEDLLCDESFIPSSTTPDSQNRHGNRSQISERCLLRCNDTGKEEFEESFLIDLQKEPGYLPGNRYVEFLGSHGLVRFRFKAIEWINKSCRRLNLSSATIFLAANYLDRFISATPCHEWKDWMVELLSIACLFTASKFSDAFYPPLHDIQAEGLDHIFHPCTIKKMEFILLDTLEWRLCATTSYAFFQLIASRFLFVERRFNGIVTARVTNLLLQTLMDPEMLDHRPSIVAMSALKLVVEEIIPSKTEEDLISITKLFNQDQEEELAKCLMIMRHLCIETSSSMTTSASGLRSPVTVLLRDHHMKGNDHVHVDLSMSLPDITRTVSGRKREREDEDE